MAEKIYFEESSGNVFEDLGLPNPEDAVLRADLAKHIAGIIESRSLTQAEVATMLGVDQSKISKLVRGRIAGFTSDRLLRFLNALGCDVRIEVKARPARGRRGKLTVVAA